MSATTIEYTRQTDYTKHNHRVFFVSYPEDNVYQVVYGLEAGPAMPMRTAGLLTPTTELLIQVKGGCAIAHLDIGEPLGDDT
jgi:hypothetical protein